MRTADSGASSFREATFWGEIAVVVRMLQSVALQCVAIFPAKAA